MARVVIDQLSKIFQSPNGGTVPAVSSACLSIEDGEFLVLVGPSGCGKSTTLRMIAGLEEITSGTVCLDGQEVNNVRPKDRDIAMVFQNHALYPHMTAYENLAFGLKLRHVPRAEIAERVGQAAEMLGLRDCLDRPPRELSGGQRQRVAVGRAIVRRPKLFLFDEPLSNLDAQLRVQMRREISQLHRRLRATMIYVTHDQVEAMTMGDRIAVMKAGVIQQVAVPMTLYHQPANLFVAGFIGSPAMNFFPGTLERNGSGIFFQADHARQKDAPGFKLRVADAMAGNLTAREGRKVVMGIRPEHIAHKVDAGNGSADWTVEAMVEAIEPLGAETYVYASSGKHSIVARGEVTVVGTGRTALAFDMTRAHFFDPVTEKSLLG
jgi:multiple sugar transport system ATP-binding protein